MARFIDLDNPEIIFCGEDGDYDKYRVPRDIMEKDVVRVVRCVDCAHRGKCECPMYRIVDDYDGVRHHKYLADTAKDNGFCAYGERRKNGN